MKISTAQVWDWAHAQFRVFSSLDASREQVPDKLRTQACPTIMPCCLDKVHSQKQRIETEFTKLYTFLEEEQQKLLERLKKEEREVLKRLHTNLVALTENSTLLRHLLAEMKERSQVPAAVLLKVSGALRLLKTVTLQEPEVVPTELKNIYNIPCIDIIQMLTAFKVDVSLDPSTAHPSLLVSEDKKSVKYRRVRQKPRPGEDNTKRFDTYVVVLGSERFTSGRHYWEVEVGTSLEWDVGVCRESVNRKGQYLALSPLTGFWRLWLRNGNEYKTVISRPTLVPMSMKPTRVGIFLDYLGGEVSFYNVTDRTHIYTYIGTFYGPLRAFFSPSRQQRRGKTHPLIIIPGPQRDTSRVWKKQKRRTAQEGVL
uniref:B30.2/SPRY domain-containing protein n=1 Tax=Salvator merianae TaxID=96440 RepID=A0A8D0DSX4_SALMN